MIVSSKTASAKAARATHCAVVGPNAVAIVLVALVMVVVMLD